MADIRKMREAVEAGTLDETLFCRVFADFELSAAMAFSGAVDAAAVLVECLLPKCEWTMHSNGQAALWPPGSVDQQNAGVFEHEVEGNPARALLVCVLKAMEAGE